MRSAKRPAHFLPKRGLSVNNVYDLHNLEPQDQLGGDNFDTDPTSVETSTGGSDAIFGLQDVHARKNKSQLTSTEYALQEIRSRVRAIDQQWEQVNVRAINTLDNIEEDDWDRLHPGRNRRGSDVMINKHRDADRKFSLRGQSGGSSGVHSSRDTVGLLEGSRAAAWWNDIGDSGRAVNRDERVAVALAQSHENLAAAATKFEESQERSNILLGGLRGWMDGFTGTARPEDTNLIAAMLPDPGLEDEVVAIMTDCQDAALMLEHSTKSHTQQLKDIFSQAGKLYGSELDRVQKNGKEITTAARDKVAELQEHANKVETLLNSLQEERNTLQFRFAGAETKCRSLEERFRADKTQLEAGLSNYRHRVMQLQQVVAGYEEKSRRLEQMDREPRLADMLGKLKMPPAAVDSGQLRQAQAEAAKLAAEITALTATNKKISQELVVLRLADQGSKRVGMRLPRSVFDARSASQSTEEAGPTAEGALREAKEQAGQAERDLLEAKRDNEALSDRLQTLLVQLDKEKQRPTIINPSAADTVEQGLRGALRDLRKKSDSELAGEIEAHRRAVGDLEAALNGEREKGDKAALAANKEISQLRSALAHTQRELQAIQLIDTRKNPPVPSMSANRGPKADKVLTEQRPKVETMALPPIEPEPREIVRVDYNGLVERAISQQERSLMEIRKKADGVGVAQRQCERGEKVFSEVVACCGKGLSSVEYILEGRPDLAEVDVEGDEATNIQAALATALERAIASASMLLKEALVGGIRACEAEKQESLHREAAEKERSKSAALAKEKSSLVDELQRKRAELAAVRTDLEAARGQEGIRQESAPPMEKAVVAPIDDSATWRHRYEHLAGLLADMTKENSGKASSPTTPVRARRSPAPSSPRRVIPDGSSGPFSTTTRPEKYPLATSIGVKSSKPIAKGAVDSFGVVSALDTKSQSTQASLPVQHSSLVSASFAPIVHDRSNNSSAVGTVAANAVGVDACVGIVPARKSSVDIGVQAEPGGAPAGTTSDGATRVVMPDGRRKSSNSGTQIVREGERRISEGASQVDFGTSTSVVGARQEDCVVETPLLGSPAEQDEIISPPADGIDRFVPNSAGEPIAHTKSQQSNGDNPISASVDGASSGEVAQVEGVNGLAGAGNGDHCPRRPGTPPSSEVTQGATKLHIEEGSGTPRAVYAASDSTANESSSEADKDKRQRHSAADGGSGIEFGNNVDEIVGLARETGDDDSGNNNDNDDDKVDHSVVVETKGDGRTNGDDSNKTVAIVQNKHDENEYLESVSKETHSWEDDTIHEGGGGGGGGVDTPWGENNSANTTDEGSTNCNQYDDIDEDELLDKLLDETAPSEMFEDDHQKLVQKFMRSRDDDRARSDVPGTTLSTETRCVECPTLKQRLDNQSADVARARVQQIAAEQELEASERRVHIMISDIASLKRTLAEHADVLKQARALADKVATEPNTKVPQVKAAQVFKDLADKVASGGRGGTPPKGKTSATGGVNFRRRQGGPLRPRSGPRSLPATKRGGGGRRGSTQVGASNVSSTLSPERRNHRKSIVNNTDGGRRRTRTSSYPGGDPVGVNRTRAASILVSTQRQAELPGRRGRRMSVPPIERAESNPGPGSAVMLSSSRISEEPLVSNPVRAPDPKIGAAAPGRHADSPNVNPANKELSLARTGSQVEPVAAFDVAIESASLLASPRQQPEDRKQILVDSDKVGVVSKLESDGEKKLSNAATVPALPVGETVTTTTTTTGSGGGFDDDHQQEPTVAAKAPSPILTSPKLLERDVREEQLLQETFNQTSERGDGGVSASSAVGTSVAVENATTAADAAAGPPLTETPPINHLEFNVAGKSRTTTTTSLAEDVLCEEEEEEEEEEDGENSENNITEEELAVDHTKTTSCTVAASDFVPTDKSLIAYCEAAARCKLAVERLESSSERPVEANLQGGGVLSQTDNHLQELTERYSNLTAAMAEWGVEAAAALLVEVAKTAAKHRTISAWAIATSFGDRSNRIVSSSEARRNRAVLLMAQKVVLREVIDAQGGWETAIFLDSGGVNFDVDVSAWPIEDQPAILSALNHHLREELEESGHKHSEALADLLLRLQASQRENEQLRADLQGYLDAASLQGLSTVKEIVVDEPLPVPLQKETIVVVEAKGNEKEEWKLKDEVVATVPPADSHDSDADRIAEATAVMDEAKKQLELQLTMTLASLRKAREDLRKEKERSRQSQQVVVPQLRCDIVPTPQVQVPQALLPLQPQPQQPFVKQERRVTPRRGNKELDLIAQADAAERRAKEAEEARLWAGYPLAALAAERRAVAELRGALTASVCAVLELCRPKLISNSGNRDSDACVGFESENAVGLDGLSFDMSDEDSLRGGFRAGIMRGPPSALVQMVCSGDDANVRCATAGYRLSKGVAGQGGRATTASGRTDKRNKEAADRKQILSSHRTSPTVAKAATAPATVSENQPSRFQEAAANVAHSGSLARNILRGLLDANSTSQSSTGDKNDEQPNDLEIPCEPPISRAAHPPYLPANPEEALAAARVASAGMRSFSTDICNIAVTDQPGDGDADVRAARTEAWASGAGTGGIGGGVGDVGNGHGKEEKKLTGAANGGNAIPEVDTTATTRVVKALREDALWAESLPAFVRDSFEAQAEGISQQVALKEREIEILTEVQGELRRELKTLKADYTSADTADVIQALRKSLRGRNGQVRYLERQLSLAEQSSEEEGGAIEVLEGLLRQRDTDKELYQSLCLKSLEIGLNIRLLQTDAGGKTVEVSRMHPNEQRALDHLKMRLVKQKRIFDVRKRTVAAELKRSLPHGMRAFERVSRAIQRLCSGYTSLPGLLQWGRTNAARLEASGGVGADGGAIVLDRDCDSPHKATNNSSMVDKRGHPYPFRGATAAPESSGRCEPWNKKQINDEWTPVGSPTTYFGGERHGGAPWSSVAPFHSSSSSSFPGQTPPASSHTPAASPDTASYYLPKMTQGGRVRGTEARRRLKTAGHAAGGGGGMPGASRHSQSVGLAGGEKELVEPDSLIQSSSVSSLLREEMAFRRRTNVGRHHGQRDDEQGQVQGGHTGQFLPGAHQGVPALVPLNNVGMPVRCRQQPRRNKGLHAHP